MSDTIPSDAVGRRILCNGEYGTVLYVGKVPPTTGRKNIFILYVFCKIKG